MIPRVLRVLAAASLLAPVALLAQTPKQAAEQWRAAHEQQILQEFTALLSIPNVASDKANIQRNADVLVAALQKRHVEARQLTAAGSNPVVYGEIKTPGAKRTIVFYAHYDGQAVNPADWESGTPFTPITKMVKGEPRIFARSASDDKAAIIAQLTALDALQAAHIPIKANLRFVWEGEEEAGSTNLGAVLEKYRDQLGGDVWLICDGPTDQSGMQSVVFGARGVTHLAITLYGPNRELHSGHYGNWAPNPAMMLVQLLGGMEDANGHVLIPHYYDGVAPLTVLEKQAIAEAPNNGELLMKEFGLGRANGNGRPLLELLNEPTLNIDGFASARVGAKANNVVPSTATVDIDMRLVKGLDWKTQQRRVVDYVAAQGYLHHRCAARQGDTDGASAGGVRVSRPRGLQRRAHADGLAHRERRDRRRRERTRASGQTPHHGWQRAAGSDREGAGHPHHHGAHRQLRQQPARGE